MVTTAAEVVTTTEMAMGVVATAAEVVTETVMGTGMATVTGMVTMSHRGCRLTMRRRCAKASRRRSSCG